MPRLAMAGGNPMFLQEMAELMVAEAQKVGGGALIEAGRVEGAVEELRLEIGDRDAEIRRQIESRMAYRV